MATYELGQLNPNKGVPQNMKNVIQHLLNQSDIPATVAAPLRRCAVFTLAAVVALSFTGSAGAFPFPFLPVPDVVSTVPGNGDLNPYGVAFVPVGFKGG